MLINGKDIDEYSCIQIRRNIYPVSVTTVEDWLDGAIQPIFVRQQDSFKKIEMVLILDAESENEAQLQLSRLTAAAKRCKVQFDDNGMPTNCEPGDVLIVTAEERGKEHGHVVVYVGNETIKQFYPDAIYLGGIY